MANRAGPRDDEAVVTDTAEQRSATWVRVAVVVAVLDTIAVAVALWVAVAADLKLDIVGTGSWINLVAVPAFPLLAALVLRPASRTGRHIGSARLALPRLRGAVRRDHRAAHLRRLRAPERMPLSVPMRGFPAGCGSDPGRVAPHPVAVSDRRAPGPRWRVVAVWLALPMPRVWVSARWRRGR